MTKNTLYYGDNLAILRDYIADETVDLIYLDPPFNSNATYNVLFKAPDGHQSQAQIEAFDDTWHWNDSAEMAFDEVMTSGNSDAAEMLRAMRSFLKENDLMAYLAMMAVRLIELHRVLKPTGSLYLHCDPTASHYLKLLLDAVFGARNFRNEIVWKRTSSHNDASQGLSRFGRTHDVLLFYAKGKAPIWHLQFSGYSSAYMKQHYSNIDEASGRYFKTSDLTAAKPGGDVSYEWKGVRPPSGRYWAYSRANMEKFDREGRLNYSRGSGMPRLKHYLDEMLGVPMGDFWDDPPPVNSQAAERLGYPTQKPVALLERILSASSNPGDVVLDPFCGCGTTLHAAAKLDRRWIGIDITHLAIGLIRRRLNEAFPKIAFDVVGVPKDVDGARALAAQDKYEFQKWALSMIEAQPYKGGKKGGDGGVDGYIYFKPDGKRTEKAIVSVKGGQSLTPAMVKDLIVTVDQEKAKMGVFLTLEPPTKGMIAQAASAGFYTPDSDQQWRKPFPKIQIVTVEQLFSPANPLQIPWQDTSHFRKAKREKADDQTKMDF